jgi:MFS family permease
VLGHRAEYVTFAWIVWEITRDPLALAYLGLAQGVPLVVFQLFGGVLADRVNRLRLLIVTQILTALTLSVALTLTVLGGARLPTLLTLAVLSNVFRAFDEPSRMSLVPSLIDRARLPNAIALGSIPWQAGRMIGPSITGILIAAFGGWVGFAMAAAGSYAALALYSRIRLDVGRPAPDGQRVLRQFTEGLGFVAANTVFLSLIGLALFNSLFAMSYLTLLPIFADTYFGMGPTGYGLLQAAHGVGALSATFTVATYADRIRRRGTALLLGAAALGFVLMAFAYSPGIRAAWPLLVLVGFCNTFYLTQTSTYLQQRVPDHLRGPRDEPLLPLLEPHADGRAARGRARDAGRRALRGLGGRRDGGGERAAAAGLGAACARSARRAADRAGSGGHDFELRAAPGDVGLGGRPHDRIRQVGRGGALAGHRGAVHDAAVAALVPRAAPVQRAAVVPHHEIAHPPAMRVHELGPGRAAEELADEIPRLVRRHAHDLARVRGDVEPLQPVRRIHPHHRLRHRRHLRGVLGRQEIIADQPARVREAVNRHLVLEQPLELGREPLPRHAHARPLRLAALGRDLTPGEQGRERGHPLERAVGVPHLVARVEEVALVAPGDELVLGVHVGEIGDLGQRARLGVDAANRDLERPEALAERDLLVIVERLSAEEQHRIGVEGGLDLGERRGIEALDVHVENLGAEQRVEPAGRDRHGEILAPGRGRAVSRGRH